MLTTCLIPTTCDNLRGRLKTESSGLHVAGTPQGSVACGESETDVAKDRHVQRNWNFLEPARGEVCPAGVIREGLRQETSPCDFLAGSRESSCQVLEPSLDRGTC
ncbi:hypothetical protein Plim_0138 [Planctopirus limnophila DSM 3776]|uniref:Uncharacterized protein n=1 Tax=Planctopirus limnophila (strain ATCC 43296 / DSM 3776 / IFAM 1008 / Mu 290) TaxID=521674 RepID=D5SN63_PLAL2|nr:hypothetical protein Plim_0138 [Planctopirus limnophila DSM 3776]